MCCFKHTHNIAFRLSDRYAHYCFIHQNVVFHGQGSKKEFEEKSTLTQRGNTVFARSTYSASHYGTSKIAFFKVSPNNQPQIMRETVNNILFDIL